MSRNFRSREGRPSGISPMVAVFVLLLAAASTSIAQSEFENRVATIEARTGGRIGVAALDTASSKHLDWRSEERFPSGSTFKFLAVSAVLKRVYYNQMRLYMLVPY